MPFELSESTTAAMRAMKAALSQLETEEGRMAGLSFKPSPGDVMLVCPPKCGTTWLCQIIHSLRSGGDMSFEELNLVIPCVEMAWNYGYRNLDAPQVALPRVYKTHCWRRDCPLGDGVKVVYVMRNPLDAGPSFYHFLGGWFFDPADITMDEFIAEFVLLRGAPPTPMQNASIWHNLASWYPHRRDANVLWLFYEDLIEDLEKCVDEVAKFLNLAQNNPALRALAVHQAGIAHMKQHPTKYDEHMLKVARNAACGLPGDAGLGGKSAGKVRKGGVGAERGAMAAETVAAMQRKWEEVVLPVTGHATYAELRASVNAELGRELGRAAA